MPNRNALAGKIVLITRPRSQSTDLARRLRCHGARLIIAPAIRIVNPRSWRKLDLALKRLESYDTLIFTSANGVSQFFKRAAKTLGRPPGRPQRLYAIGPQTARALMRRGWHGIGVPETYEGEALAKRLGRVRNQRILIPRAQKARDVLPRLLRKRGAQVDVVEAYRTISDTAGLARIRRAIAQGSVDIVTFTSSSTVDKFMSAAPRSRILRFFRSATAAAIGPITSSTLRRFGIRRIVEARTYTTDGLARAIVRAVNHGRH